MPIIDTDGLDPLVFAFICDTIPLDLNVYEGRACPLEDYHYDVGFRDGMISAAKYAQSVNRPVTETITLLEHMASVYAKSQVDPDA